MNEGTGHVYGMFVVESLSTTRTFFFKDGGARRIEFQLALKRIDENLLDRVASLGKDVLKFLM